MLVATVKSCSAHATGYHDAGARRVQRHSRFCKDYTGSGVDPETNRGECISLLTQQFHYVVDDKNANAYAQHACDYYSEVDPVFFNSLWDSEPGTLGRSFVDA